MSTPDLGELRRLLEAATPRPWFSRDPDAIFNPSVATRRQEDAEDEPLDDSEWVAECGPRDERGRQDAALIAAAVNALPALLDDLEAARAEIATLTAQRDRAERRHERLGAGVEALNASLARVNPAHFSTALVRGRIRALLAESAASEEGA